MAAKKPMTPAEKTEAEQLQKALENMALNIQKISDAFSTLEKSPVNRRLLRLLVNDLSGVSYIDIDRVLDALPALAKNYLRKPA